VISSFLGEAYFDPSKPAAFGSVDKLARAARQSVIAKASDVKPWLEAQNAYTLHKPVRKIHHATPTVLVTFLKFLNVIWLTYRPSLNIIKVTDIS
jgi:hypothetical protein